MEVKEEILRIIDILNDSYESEEAWHGPSVVEVLKDVSPRLAEGRLATNTHSIAEIVYHMTTWRIFVVRKLQGDAGFDVQALDKDWKKFGAVDDFEWEALQMELSLSQDELINELENLRDDGFLEEIVPGRNYSYYTMLHGIVHHDMYHTGQIALIKKGLVLASDSREAYDDDRYNHDYDLY